VRAALDRALRLDGYDVELAADGRQALDRVAEVRHDAIVLDVAMPGLDGLQVCRRLRDAGDRTPVLMLTARDAVADRVEGLDAGADDYLPKPYHFPELVARVRALLRRGPALADAVIRVADLAVDTRARRVERGGDVVRLTTKEYALLEYLARRHGEVVGRADIAEHVWDDSFDPLSNLIEVYIQRLRRKIDDGRPLKLIHTRRGAGYALAASFEGPSDD
jgi:DNA-binding response OmpR family regulator